MTTRPEAQCGACARYRSPFSPENTSGLEGPFCAAFPTGIPDRIFNNEVDHRQPIEGDHGLQWISRDGAEFPTYAFIPALTAAAAPASGATYSGAMVALIPAAADAADLAIPDGEPADQLHCTLLYLGEAADLDEQTRADIVDQCRAVAAGWDGMIEADGFSVAVFNPHGDDPCVVLGLSGADLAGLHDQVAEMVDVAGEQHQPWIPHITLAYTDDAGLVAEVTDRCGVVAFDRLRVGFAGDHVDIPLGEALPEPPPEEPPVEEPVVAARAVWTGCPYCFRDAHDGPCG